MDAELEQKAAQMFNSPLWRWTLLRYGGKFSDRADQYRGQVEEALLKAGTFDNLPQPIQTFIDQSIESYEVDNRLFGGKGADFLSEDELNAIAAEFSESVEEEEIA